MTDAESRMVHAPFTEDQAASLNAYQRASVFHPFTCGNRSDDNHFGDESELVAMAGGGWVCAFCDYRQDWAWAVMADWSWVGLARLPFQHRVTVDGVDVEGTVEEFPPGVQPHPGVAIE